MWENATDWNRERDGEGEREREREIKRERVDTLVMQALTFSHFNTVHRCDLGILGGINSQNKG